MAKARNPSPLTDAQRAIAEEYLAKWDVLRLVASKLPAFIRKCYVCGMMPDDIRQAGAMGVLKAARLFEAERGNKFATYAWYWVRAEIGRWCGRWHRNRIGSHIGDGDSRGRVFSGDYEYNGRGNVPESAWDHFGIADPISNDEAVEESRRIMAMSEQIQAALKFLSRRHRQVIEMRFGFDGRGGMTLEEVGKKMGVTRERVRQMQLAAIKKIGLPLQVSCADLFTNR